MKIRLEGTEKEIKAFLEGDILSEKAYEKIKNISKFYPNKAFGFDRSEPQKEGRVYLEIV